MSKKRARVWQNVPHFLLAVLFVLCFVCVFNKLVGVNVHMGAALPVMSGHRPFPRAPASPRHNAIDNLRELI